PVTVEPDPHGVDEPSLACHIADLAHDDLSRKPTAATTTPCGSRRNGSGHTALSSVAHRVDTPGGLRRAQADRASAELGSRGVRVPTPPSSRRPSFAAPPAEGAGPRG